ncbi:hypothetical protein RRG08_021074 [Elysia crispata]|uniref:Uncharacterized protein n=1 Tax=Elysia crispata TaxID=231223 RepID=A0AAE1AJL8_9GAST|nr:hypothetical protein RRG08_021074 [Elysia crispata]
MDSEGRGSEPVVFPPGGRVPPTLTRSRNVSGIWARRHAGTTEVAGVSQAVGLVQAGRACRDVQVSALT